MGRKALTKEEFLEKAFEVHGDRYSYEKTEYIHSKKKVIVLCKIHGEFEQTPCIHMQGGGCKACRNADFSNKYSGPKRKSYSTSLSQSELNQNFITKAREVHGNSYNYSKVTYTSSTTPVCIICPVHGEFEQLPINHYKGGKCTKCNGTHALKYTTNEFIDIANKVHNYKYNYSKFEYLGTRETSNIICPEHGIFQQLPEVHLLGSSCPECASYGFKRNLPAILYYLSINNGEAYKIGITNTSLETRFGSDIKKIKVISTWKFMFGIDAYNAEQEILRNLRYFKYVGEPLLKVGNTELFNTCVLDKVNTILDNHKYTRSLVIT